MIRTHKTFTFWTNQVRPNPLPAQTFPNLSLGKTAITLAIYVPMYSAEENVNFVQKEKTPANNGGEAYDLVQPSFKDMTGAGINDEEYALLHPIKVLFLFRHLDFLYNMYNLFYNYSVGITNRIGRPDRTRKSCTERICSRCVPNTSNRRSRRRFRSENEPIAEATYY